MILVITTQTKVEYTCSAMECTMQLHCSICNVPDYRLEKIKNRGSPALWTSGEEAGDKTLNIHCHNTSSRSVLFVCILAGYFCVHVDINKVMEYLETS